MKPAKPFELDSGSGPGIVRPDLGKAKLLTEVLTEPFRDIEERLSQHWTARSEHTVNTLRFDMKSYLSRLNANPLIPLRFRLMVLNRFEEEMGLFDDHLVAALFNAYSIAVDLILEATVREPDEYFPLLVEVAADAVAAGIGLFRLSLETYQSPGIVPIRLIYNLERQGLSALHYLPAGSDTDSLSMRLQQLVARLELQKALDFFGKSPTEQKIIWQILQQHSGTLEPRFYQHRESPSLELTGRKFLLSNLSRPDQAPYLVSGRQEKFPGDVIVIPLVSFLTGLAKQYKEARLMLKSGEMQQKNMHTEEELQRIITGNALILGDLIPRDRAKRFQYQEVVAHIEPDLKKALAGSSGKRFITAEASVSDGGSGEESAWSIVDISRTGAGFKRYLSNAKSSLEIGALTGLRWPLRRGEPELGFVRWFREAGSGEQCIGIEFLQGNFLPASVSLTGAHAIGSLRLVPPWPVIVEQRLGALRVFSPERNVSKGNVLHFSGSGVSGLYRVHHIIRTGPNYVLFLANPLEGED